MQIANKIFASAFVFAVLNTQAIWGAAAGSLSGIITDPSGASIPHASVELTNLELKTHLETSSDAHGFYSFPAVPVAHYDLRTEAPRFATEDRKNLIIDTSAALRIDIVLDVGHRQDVVTVTETQDSIQTRPDTAATYLGQAVSGKQMQAVPLNGRSYTDLLAILPGVSPVTTLTPTSVIMAGVTGTINPSGDLNPGNVSIDGQRESANGFMVNAIDVQEHMNGGASVIPNLDSIEELRVLTNNFDAEYGNYNGGLIDVVTKSGGNGFHGDGFEFLRNTDLDARNYFDRTRGVFRQNQFGGSIGGPIKRQAIFFFVDYQGTRTVQGITSAETQVPSFADRSGSLSDLGGSLTGTVAGPYAARLLSQKLGYSVTPGERYYTPGCTSSAVCVLPNAVIPIGAWSSPASDLLKYIPEPNAGSNLFVTSAYPETVRDDKGSARLDANTRLGHISGTISSIIIS